MKTAENFANRIIDCFLFILILLTSTSYSGELICEPDSQFASINQKIDWAKSKGCSHLKLKNETNTSIMNLSTGEEKIVEDSVKIEPNNKTEQKEESILKESRNYIEFLYGFSYSNKIGGRLDWGFTSLWNFNSFWLETILLLRINISEDYFAIYTDPGIKVSYPFSKKINTFYIGGGGGFSLRESYGNYEEGYSVGFFAENSIGYTFLFRNGTPAKIEAFSTVIFHEEKSISGGLRFAFNLLFETEEEIAKRQEQAEITKKRAEEENKTKEKRRNYFRLAFNDFSIPTPKGSKSGTGFTARIIPAKISIFKNIVFEPEVGLSTRNLNINYGYHSKLDDFTISIPLILKIMPFGGPRFYIEAGPQIDIPFFTEFENHESYDSRANFDFGIAGGLGWNFKSFSLGLRGIVGLTNFSKEEDSFEKPIQMEFGINF